MNLTDKETADIRVACLKMFVDTGSKVSLSGDMVFAQAEEAYQFAVKTLVAKDKPRIGRPPKLRP